MRLLFEKYNRANFTEMIELFLDTVKTVKKTVKYSLRKQKEYDKHYIY